MNLSTTTFVRTLILFPIAALCLQANPLTTVAGSDSQPLAAGGISLNRLDSLSVATDTTISSFADTASLVVRGASSNSRNGLLPIHSYSSNEGASALLTPSSGKIFAVAGIAAPQTADAPQDNSAATSSPATGTDIGNLPVSDGAQLVADASMDAGSGVIGELLIANSSAAPVSDFQGSLANSGFNAGPVGATPEPATMGFVGACLVGLAVFGSSRRKRC